MPAHIAAMDIAVAPYRSSPHFYFSPLKVYEYLAAGRAVVASNIGQIATIIGHGSNGYLVPPDDVAELTLALEHLGADKRVRDALARQAPHGLVSWTDTAARILAIAGRNSRILA
jgi:glycosyltransferase involved in cell wall biosynthesis